MTNLDKLKAKIANMDSEEFYKTVVDLYLNPKYCAFSSPDGKCKCGANIECGKGIKTWLDLELEECKECLCNKCPLSNSYKCDNCKDCIKKEKREIVKDCGCDRCIFRDKDCTGITCEEALRKSLEQEEGANND